MPTVIKGLELKPDQLDPSLPPTGLLWRYSAQIRVCPPEPSPERKTRL